MKLLLNNCGLWVEFDRDDLVLVDGYNWWGSQHRNTWYARSWKRLGEYNRVRLSMHRLILGVDDPKVWIDHVDGNGLNNKRSNLRVVSYSESAINRRILPSGSSQYMGVWWHKATGKWQVTIDKNYVGLFEDEIEAAKAYDREAIKRHGTYARLNFPDTWAEAK